MSTSLDTLQLSLTDRYAIERQIGRGGMATVYLATDAKVGRRVAIKVLLPDLAAAVGGERFHREIQIATHLTHPNILPIYDSGEAGSTLYYVMPFVEGESLRDRLTRERQLAIDDAIRITCQVASGLDHAHRANIIHRDIKPENILLESGQAVIADFGIARAVTSVTDYNTLTGTGISLGTPAYMSPEQAMGERNLDGRTDQYALACVAYEMLAGQPPFTASTMQAIVARHVAEDAPLITTVRPAVPDEVEDVILRALEKVPADRFPTIGQFAEALADAASVTITRPRRTTGSRTLRGTRSNRAFRKRPWSSKKRVATVATAVLLVAGTAAAGIWAWPRPASSSVRADGSFNPKRIAVLYFADESRGNEFGYLADALTESLIGELDQVRALDVISKNGVAPFRGSNTDVDSVAAALRAGTIVRGSIEGVGDHVHVTFRLIDGNSGAEYDRAGVDATVAGALRAPRAVAEKVADLLRERLGPEVRLREERLGTTNPEAWSLVQRAEKTGKEALALVKSDSGSAGMQRFADADSLLARAEVLDPKWSVPPTTRGRLALREITSTDDGLRRSQLVATGLEHAQRALTLDPRSAEAYEVRGTLRYYKRQLGLAPDPTEAADLLRTAEEDLRKATTLDESRASAWNTLSALLYQKFNRVESNLAARRAYEADAYLSSAPEIIWRLYATSYDLEQFVDASQWCDVGHKRYPADPRFFECQMWLQTTNIRPPNVAEEWRLLGEVQKLTPKSEWPLEGRQMTMVVAVPIARAGMIDSARRVIVRARAGPDVDPRGELTGAEVVIRALIGDKDEALNRLKIYLTAHPEHRIGYTRHRTWWYRSLQDDPRFKAIVGNGE